MSANTPPSFEHQRIMRRPLMEAPYILNVPQALMTVVQSALLERSFHDALFPALLGRWEGDA